MIQTFQSQTFPFAAGSKIPCPLDFVERRGVNGGRLVIQRIELVVSADLTTGAGVTLDGEDLHTLIARWTIKDAAGIRVDLTGEQVKLLAQADMRHRMPATPADVVANVANQLRTVRFPVPFSRMNDFAPDDCAMPTDDLLNGGSITITWPATASLPWAGGTGTINAGTSAVIQIHCREEYDLVMHSRDERNALLQEAVATVRIPVEGNLLRSAYLQQGSIAGGGGSLAGITEVTFPTLGQVQLSNALLANLYEEEGGPTAVVADDLVLSGRALPIIVNAEREKMRDRPRINGTLLGRLVTTETVLASQVYHLITPKDRRVVQSALTVNGIVGEPKYTVKTVGKSVSDPAAWGGAIAFMPEKVVQ